MPAADMTKNAGASQTTGESGVEGGGHVRAMHEIDPTALERTRQAERSTQVTCGVPVAWLDPSVGDCFESRGDEEVCYFRSIVQAEHDVAELRAASRARNPQRRMLCAADRRPRQNMCNLGISFSHMVCFKRLRQNLISACLCSRNDLDKLSCLTFPSEFLVNDSLQRFKVGRELLPPLKICEYCVGHLARRVGDQQMLPCLRAKEFYGNTGTDKLGSTCDCLDNFIFATATAY